MLTITAFMVLSFIKSVTSTQGRLKVYLDSINGNKFNKGSLEFHNDRFVDSYDGSFLDLVFQNNIDYWHFYFSIFDISKIYPR